MKDRVAQVQDWDFMKYKIKREIFKYFANTIQKAPKLS